MPSSPTPPADCTHLTEQPLVVACSGCCCCWRHHVARLLQLQLLWEREVRVCARRAAQHKAHNNTTALTWKMQGHNAVIWWCIRTGRSCGSCCEQIWALMSALTPPGATGATVGPKAQQQTGWPARSAACAALEGVRMLDHDISYVFQPLPLLPELTRACCRSLLHLLSAAALLLPACSLARGCCCILLHSQRPIRSQADSERAVKQGCDAHHVFQGGDCDTENSLVL